MFFKRSILVSGFICSLMLISYKEVVCQTVQDPLTIDPLQRNTAGFETPWGVTFTTRFPIQNSVVGDNEERYIGEMRSAMRFGIQTYYDAWQLGLHFKEYGNTITLMSRTVGRDNYMGWGIEVGHSSNKTVIVGDLETKQEYDSKEYSALIAGLTFNGRTGMGDEWKFSTLYELTAGIAKSDESTFYTSLELGFGARIPISTTALTVNASLYAGFVPSTTLYARPGGENYGDPNNFASGYGVSVLGIGLNAAYAINFFQ